MSIVNMFTYSEHKKYYQDIFHIIDIIMRHVNEFL